MDPEAERSLVQLKSELEALDYNQPLGLESAPLVRQLLDDLVLTTENYESLRQRATQAEANRDLLQNQVYSLRRDHARLTRENNQVRPAPRP